MMSKYAITFMLVNIGLAVVVTIILETLGISFNLANIVYAILAALFTGMRFVKKENRVATDDEKKEFAKLSLIYMTILGVLIMVGLSVLTPIFSVYLAILSSPSTMMIFFGVTLVLFVVYYFAIKFFFGYGAKSEMEKRI